jgi:hypothetical protein
MKNALVQISIFLMVLLVNSAFCQESPDTVLLLSGDVVTGKLVRLTNEDIVMKSSEKVVQEFNIDRERVFSYTTLLGEEVLYKYDTLAGNYFSIEEMRYFIKGEQDGKKGFKARPAFYTNILIGAAGGVTGSFFFPIPAFTFAILVGIPKVRIDKATVRDPECLNHIPYIMGYERMARRNRKIQALIGGGIGLAAGLGGFLILQASDRTLLK